MVARGSLYLYTCFTELKTFCISVKNVGFGINQVETLQQCLRLWLVESPQTSVCVPFSIFSETKPVLFWQVFKNTNHKKVASH